RSDATLAGGTRNISSAAQRNAGYARLCRPVLRCMNAVFRTIVFHPSRHDADSYVSAQRVLVLSRKIGYKPPLRPDKTIKGSHGMNFIKSVVCAMVLLSVCATSPAPASEDL